MAGAAILYLVGFGLAPLTALHQRILDIPPAMKGRMV
jgi:hypothetical protein